MPCLDESIAPMTLGNMRSLGVRALFVTSRDAKKLIAVRRG
jgi:hypothetical protein